MEDLDVHSPVCGGLDADGKPTRVCMLAAVLIRRPTLCASREGAFTFEGKTTTAAL